MAAYQTPGVSIQDQNGFPNTVVAVETAVPVFIGYTEKAIHNGTSLVGRPVRVNSLAEYEQLFGKGFQHKFKLKTAADVKTASGSSSITRPAQMFYLYNCMRLYIANGGGSFYVLCAGTYGEGAGKKKAVDVADFIDALLAALEKCPEPTLVLVPDLVTKRNDCYNLYKKILQHCHKMQSRFALLDVIPAPEDAGLQHTLQLFREGIGGEALNYGAAYYPWLHTSIVPESEINNTCLSVSLNELKQWLPEKEAAAVIDQWINAAESSEPAQQTATAANTKNDTTENSSSGHQALTAVSSTYRQIMNEIKAELNLLPPSAAIAGIYCMVDSSRGVWKAPANVALSMVEAPAEIISDEQQQNMNIDIVAGKSVNALRPFPGMGTLVWGAKTLDGNSQDWRYINVRRTMMMIEQSLKLACSAYVFEPNNANTWATVKSMITHFLTSLWKQGALAGAVAEEAFTVQVGLGATITPEDILQGILRVTVLLAITRPDEFIELTLQQQQQSA